MSYKSDFNLFLSSTNEKKVLLREIIKELKLAGVTSLLDIGAGNGLLSVPLAKTLPHYIAVEPHKDFAATLRSNNIEVIEEYFPIAAPLKAFDAVLSCHSLSYKQHEYEPFIEAALNTVKDKGIFLLITFRGRKDKWTKLMADIGEEKVTEYQEEFQNILRQLHRLGRVSIRIIKTRVKTRYASEMIRALAFVHSDGDMEKKKLFLKKYKKIKKALDQRHKYASGYSFVFDHVLVRTEKK